MGQERELKFRIEPALHAAVLSHPVLATLAPPPRTQLLQSWYFDTADHRLRQARMALRVRDADDGRRLLCLKSSGSPERPQARGEWEFPVAGNAPTDADLARLGDTPLAAVGGAGELAGSLAPTLGTRVRRTVWTVEWEGARLEVCLDAGDALGGASDDAPRLPISELEIELLDGDWMAAFDLAWALAQDLPLHLSPGSKAELAARAAGLAPLRLPALARELPQHATVGNAIATVLQQSLALVAVGAELLAVDPQAETVHQMRLQLRRLRVLLRLLESVGPKALARTCRWLRGEWRWAGQLLGAVRDVDVCREFAQSLREAAPDAPQSAAALAQSLENKRTARVQALNAYLGGARFGRLLLAQARWAEDWAGGGVRLHAAPSVADLARRLLRFHDDELPSLRAKHWDMLLATWDANARTPSDAPWTELHRLRLRAKQRRYALEWLRPWVDDALGVRAAAWLRLSDGLQSDLGQALDTLRLARWTGDSGPLPTAEAAALRERWTALAFSQARSGLDRARRTAKSAA